MFQFSTAFFILAHGTFIGTMRLEPHKPTQLHVNSTFHFGASTRNYILRERPSAGQRTNIMEDIPMSESSDGALLGLPESQTELDVSDKLKVIYLTNIVVHILSILWTMTML